MNGDYMQGKYIPLVTISSIQIHLTIFIREEELDGRAYKMELFLNKLRHEDDHGKNQSFRSVLQRYGQKIPVQCTPYGHRPASLKTIRNVYGVMGIKLR